MPTDIDTKQISAIIFLCIMIKKYISTDYLIKIIVAYHNMVLDNFFKNV